MVIYSLLFLKYTQRPLACHARHPQNIQPKPQVHTNQALWDLGQANRNDRAYGQTQDPTQTLAYGLQNFS